MTADSGIENSIIIWDAIDHFPQKTLFNPHGPTKLAKVALSADAKYLLTLAYPEKAAVYWWIWSFGLDIPHGILVFIYEYIVYIFPSREYVPHDTCYLPMQKLSLFFF